MVNIAIIQINFGAK